MVIFMSIFSIVFITIVVKCSTGTSAPVGPITIAQRVDISKLPKGIDVSQFEEKYEAYKGKWSMTMVMKNNTAKKIEYPQIDADLYRDAELVGTATGGPGKHLKPGESGTVSYAWIIAEKVPTKIELKYIQ